MTRKVFYSFHYVPDNWRASQVRNMGVIEGNQPAKDNDWEEIKRGGDTAIQKWIDGQLHGRSCTAVLIGSGTAGRKWINYEIKKTWADGKGVFGIYVHNLKNSDGFQASKGKNPFGEFNIDHFGEFNKIRTPMSSIVNAYDPPYSDSAKAYSYIKDNISSWIETAIAIRGKY